MRLGITLLLVAGCSFDTSGGTASGFNRSDDPGPMPLVCPSGYDAAPTGSCYRLELQEQSWNAAETACEDDGPGSHMVVIDDGFENDYVGSLIADVVVWIGLARESAGLYRWVTGEVAGFVSWESDAPDEQDEQDCVLLRNDKMPAGWDDKDCAKGRAYLCEYDAVAVSGR